MGEQASAMKVAIVTGAGRGLGRAMWLGLARAGYRVVATAAREQTEIADTAAASQAALGDDRIIPMVADVTNDNDVSRVVATALDRFGRIDVLVNNAGRGMKYVDRHFMTEPTKFWRVEPSTWRMIVDTNVNGPFLMARAVTPHLISAGWGRIVNISMNHATMRRAGFSPYGPTKAALESETVIWAADLQGTGVTVNALLPGGASMTGMIPDAFPAAARASLLDPAIMVPPVLWLASADSDGVTGRRFVAKNWRADDPLAAAKDAGWTQAED